MSASVIFFFDFSIFVLTNRLPFGIITVAGFPAGVAQPVEQLICNQQVGGSNPSTSSKRRRKLRIVSLLRGLKSSLPPLLLLFKSNPLRWASI